MSTEKLTEDRSGARLGTAEKRRVAFKHAKAKRRKAKIRGGVEVNENVSPIECATAQRSRLKGRLDQK